MVGRSWTISNSGVAQFSFLLEIGCWAGVCDSVEMQKRNEKYIYIYKRKEVGTREGEKRKEEEKEEDG